MRTTPALCLLGTTFVLAAGCASAGRKAAWEVAAPAAATGTSSTSAAGAQLRADGNAAWAKRDDKAQLQLAIDKWEAAAKADPSDAETQVSLARAYYFLVDGHLNNEQPADLDALRLDLHKKAAEWGESALLLLDPKFAETMRAGGEFEKAIGLIEKPAVPAAYWYCTNLSRFALAKGMSTRLFYKDRVFKAMTRIKELDPGYFYGGPDRYFGGYYAALPSFMGRDFNKSGEHFKAAVALSPEYLTTRIVQAEFLAIGLDDRALYEKLMNEVLAGADTDNADIAPENRAAKRTATRLLPKAADLF